MCLFEKEPTLGGRIHDVVRAGDDAGARIGAGARRIMEGQDFMSAEAILIAKFGQPAMRAASVRPTPRARWAGGSR